ncbi:hypothetical protein VIS19158_10904 [Vibrio scophthalmi LMG 19158]|uniref:Lipoprotein n=1 Tax=Vibrio scophthalmi LMG 19158 TaxID=870967 RepID=F9RQM9_9VIBR|nr:hypothetical protein VIS19158_10904 [Vibrio scophthalmi LMG 19158]
MKLLMLCLALVLSACATPDYQHAPMETINSNE